MAASRWATIPEPVAALPNLRDCVVALKTNMELVTGQRGPVASYSMDQQILVLNQAVTTGPNSLTAQIININELSFDTTNPQSLASEINSVTATANGISANGAITLKAIANPITGVTASYQWELTAGSVSCGMNAFAMSGGGASIGFTASQFGLIDAGTLQPVFSYGSGVFTFNAPVQIRTADIQNAAITSAKIGNLQVQNANIGTLVVGNSNVINNAITQSTGAASAATSTTVSLTTRASNVAIWGLFEGNSSGLYPIAGTTIGTLELLVDGSVVASVGNSFFTSGSNLAFLNTSAMIVAAVSAGSHTFEVFDTNGPGVGGVIIVVTELSK